MRKALSIAVMVVSAFAFISFSGVSAFAADTTGTDQTTTGSTDTTGNGGGDATNTSCSSTTVTINNGGDQTGSNTSTGTDCPTTTTPTTPVTPSQGAGTPTTATPAATTPTVLPYTAGPSPLAGVITAVAATALAGAGLLFLGVRALRR